MARIVKLPDGGRKIWLSANDTYNWARGVTNDSNRPSTRWPNSALSKKSIFAEFDKDGNLVDVTFNGREVSPTFTQVHEFHAIMDDFIGDK